MEKYKRMEDHSKIKWSQIDDNIYIGTNQCCQIHFDKELLLQGITTDISLEDVKIDSPFGVESYLWLPTKDHTASSQDQLRLGVAHLTQLINVGRKVYVHCRNGHGRAPTLVAAYYISTGLSVEEATNKIKNKREEVHLNDEQIEALELFAENI
ncbi:hypothetical protein CO173_03605 [Candidatus Uhrbacteria bacterium CG_4_9_14_3_um_filter_41_35]|uniref:Uncharacterized protein n=1 Tax=Candidatus Uhrbacteria bacterium CG_4_9_14_3_um_filter_41_35 TaxID=1975034 RepID=A0A2M7XE01_9BACT|nr:MAG: hypothetical protein COV92_02145 [Candidatus Uhrbacteria bacterium CG11_big_fil_rev_8_21_14_0_20_41_9]PJA46099.1 MAG: hypothetical protein CO173_03605 [Candidatus Uhrbacteria bacterium CG_4_9_14_3_um_filter_41_35]